jgi:hypothetical protein
MGPSEFTGLIEGLRTNYGYQIQSIIFYTIKPGRKPLGVCDSIRAFTLLRTVECKYHNDKDVCVRRVGYIVLSRAPKGK